MTGWFTALGLDPAVTERYPWNKASRPTSLAENIDGVPEDDDLNFTMLGVLLLERCGPDFDEADVAKLWLDYLPAGRIFTAERVALRNLLEAYLPPETATRRNPFREWVGARLRVDAYGWAAAGDPVRAARMAWRDARVSHTANGVYAAMFMAAAHAASLGVDSRRRVRRRRALGDPAREPPRRGGCAPPAASTGAGRRSSTSSTSGTAASTAFMRSTTPRSSPPRSTRFDEFSPAICAAVQGGWDTDTNGAAVGSIFGALGPIEERWSAPLHGRFASSLPTFDGITLAELVERTARRLMTDEAPAFDPLVPRPIDRPTFVPLEGPLDALDGAKILAAPDDPADWPAWRERLAAWREDARARMGYDGATYDLPELAWTQRCFSCALVWLWDELLYDREAGRFTPDRLLDEGEREFGGYDGARALARLPGDRDRRAEPVRLLPGRPRHPRARRRHPGSRRARVRRLQPVGHRHAARGGIRRARRSPRSCASSAPTASSSTR